jgi:hypothetical protein
VALVPASPASAAVLTGNIVVSSPTTGKVAANTPKQVILLTLTVPAGTTVSDENITKVNLGATRCQDMEFYIVTGSSQIAAKTPDDATPANDGCAPTASGTETIEITFANGDTLTKASSNLVFVTPPAIDDVADKPVITDLSSALPDADQINRFNAAGGQTVRIDAGSAFSFAGGTTAGLAVSMGGKPLTEVKAWSNATPPVQLTGAGAGSDVGNFLTGKTATGMTTSSPTVVITQNGVSKTFTTAETGITIVNMPVITGISPTSGKADVATDVTLTGTGFGTTGMTATVCGVTAVVKTQGNATGTSMVITVPNSGIADSASGLGSDVFSGPCPIVVTNSSSVVSPTTAAATFTVLAE